MRFVVDKEIFKIMDNLFIGVIYAEGISNSEDVSEITQFFQSNSACNTNTGSNNAVSDAPNLALYRDGFNKLGINAKKYPSSIESLVSRLEKQGQIPSINPAVDLANAISVKHSLAVGAHDVDTFISGRLDVRFTSEGDSYAAFHSEMDETVEVGEPAYVSGNEVRTRRWIWRQSEKGKITQDSSNILFLVDGFSEIKDAVLNARNELAGLLEKHFGCDVKIGFIDKERRTFVFGALPPKEQTVENTLQMMIKGTALHSDEDGIRSKIETALEENRPLRVKLGLDPSAPDIHIGHAVVLRKMKQLQDLGHHVIIIIGDFTGKIGDPTGKSKTRVQLTDEQVKANAETYKKQIFKILDQEKTKVVFNSEWLSKLTFEDVIHLASKVTVARILERDDFTNRFNSHTPISLHEFFYPLMQAYDSVALNADIEVGATDQVFNVLMGRNIQQDYGQQPQVTLFMPILEGLDGKDKMSKSLGNYVGINEPPEVMYRKIMTVPDHLITRYYELCSDMPQDEIEKIRMRLDLENPRDIKMELAKTITALYCGADMAAYAEKCFIEAFQEKKAPANTPDLYVDLSDGGSVYESLISALFSTEKYKSKSALRRLFSQNAVALNNEKVTEASFTSPIQDGDIIQIGKGTFFRLKTHV